MKFDNDIFVEDKKAVCDAMCEALRKTSAAGNPINNALVELRYVERMVIMILMLLAIVV